MAPVQPIWEKSDMRLNDKKRTQEWKDIVQEIMAKGQEKMLMEERMAAQKKLRRIWRQQLGMEILFYAAVITSLVGLTHTGMSVEKRCLVACLGANTAAACAGVSVKLARNEKRHQEKMRDLWNRTRE